MQWPWVNLRCILSDRNQSDPQFVRWLELCWSCEVFLFFATFCEIFLLSLLSLLLSLDPMNHFVASD